ncbi:unnamed protein product [Eruca vesicaria subsp. sativa]|uniref:Telomeric single stranded DNA binding POT1/Cdc13 domain-containing protein n=1 Tax=Eruca vesicaria subsp. sativa TaxID=29727 RepID=A0ABC8JNP2_ERUVS|nr:unnamed protein product [Eruca vesicaria subsp. sativa]
METKKRESRQKLVKLKDATNLINQHVNLLGFVLERRQPKQCCNKDWFCTLHIIDDSYHTPGLTVNVFSNKFEELPRTDNQYDRMILFINVKMQAYNGGRNVNAACNKRVSSFALYKRGTGQEDFVCYQCTSNFLGDERYKSSIDELGKLFATSGFFDQGQALQSLSYKTKAQPPKFSFLREINEEKRFNLVCKILHVSEDKSTIFVWDGTDAPPASIRFRDTSVSNISVNTLLSRDILRSFPTVGTVLRVSLSNPQFGGFKPGDWLKLYQLLCVFDKGSWIGKVTDSTAVSLAQDDRLVEKIMRIYDKRITSKMGHIPFWSFPSPPGLTEIDDDEAPFVTLMDIITFPKVTYKYRCIVRVVAAFPSHVEEFSSDESGHNRVLLTLEDPTATLEAFLCGQDAELFWGLGFQNTEMLRNKWNQLLGIRRGSSSFAARNPPWIECCIFSYYTNKADPWRTRSYKIFGTRLLD